MMELTNGVAGKAQLQVLDPGTNYEILETATDAEPKLEAAIYVESPIDKSFSVWNPLQWFKWTFPCILFTTLMTIETVDVISDCLQLKEVVEKFGKYSAPPFVQAGTMDKVYTVIWEKVDIVGTNDSMLGYSLAWEGNPSGAKSIAYSQSAFIELDCLANGEFSGSGHLLHSNKVRSRGSEYKSEEICVSLSDVFSYKFPKPFPKVPVGATALCPNNATAIFDESSFLLQQTFSEYNIRNYGPGCEYDYGCGKDIFVISETKDPVNMLDYYRPNWLASLMTTSQCYTLYAIYISTIIFFSFSAACLVLQVGQFAMRFRRDPPDAEDKKAVAEFKKKRAQALVEFPMIGFLLALIYLDEEGWDFYAEVDYSYTVNHPEYLYVHRIFGFHDKDNLLHVPVWAGYAVKGEENPPKSITLGQKVFHYFGYPLSKEFKEVFIGDDSDRFFWMVIYYMVFPGTCLWCFSFLMTISIPMTLLMLAYGDKLILGRILIDLPDLCLATVYVAIIEVNTASILSITFSAFLMAYYLSEICYMLYMDMVRPHPPRIFPIDNLYGQVTGRCEACYQAFVMPFTQVALWWVVIPATFFRNSLVYAAPDDDGSKPLDWYTIMHLIGSLCIPNGIFVVIIVTTIIVAGEEQHRG